MASLNEEAAPEVIEVADAPRASATTDLFEFPGTDAPLLFSSISSPAADDGEARAGRRLATLALVALAALLLAAISPGVGYRVAEVPARRALDAVHRRVQIDVRARHAAWQRAFWAVKLQAPPRVFAGEPWVLQAMNGSAVAMRLTTYSWQDQPADVRVLAGGTIALRRVFPQPGWRTVYVSPNGDRRIRQELRVYVRPRLRPGKQPAPLPPGLVLSAEPRDWHLVLNIYNHARQLQQNTVYFRGEVVQRFLISTGTEGHPTPQGTWWVVEKRIEPWSTLYDVPMPYWSGLANGWSSGLFGLHTLSDSNFQAYLGGPASHGCIRHAPAAARWLYEHVPIGTRVDIVSRPQ